MMNGANVCPVELQVGDDAVVGGQDGFLPLWGGKDMAEMADRGSAQVINGA